MKRVKIIKDTFISGNFASKGRDYDVDDRTAMYLISANKALEINPTTGKEKKEDLSGIAETMPKLKKEAPSAEEVVAEKTVIPSTASNLTQEKIIPEPPKEEKKETTPDTEKPPIDGPAPEESSGKSKKKRGRKKK